MGGDCSRAADHAQRDLGEGFNTDGQQLKDDEDEALQQKSESAPDASASSRPAAPVLRVMVNQEWVPLQVMDARRACVPVAVARGLFLAHNDSIHGGSSLLTFCAALQ